MTPIPRVSNPTLISRVRNGEWWINFPVAATGSLAVGLHVGLSGTLVLGLMCWAAPTEAAVVPMPILHPYRARGRVGPAVATLPLPSRPFFGAPLVLGIQNLK